MWFLCFFFFFSSRRRHTRYWRDWSSDVCSSDLGIWSRSREEVCDGSIRHDFCNAQHHDQAEKQQIDIRLHFAVPTEKPNVTDDLLARGRCGRALPGQAREAARLKLE